MVFICAVITHINIYEWAACGLACISDLNGAYQTKISLGLLTPLNNKTNWLTILQADVFNLKTAVNNMLFCKRKLGRHLSCFNRVVRVVRQSWLQPELAACIGNSQQKVDRCLLYPIQQVLAFCYRSIEQEAVSVGKLCGSS